MTNQELETIFNRLRDQTARKQIKWKALNPRELRIDFPRSSVVFYKPSNEQPYLSILNSGGSSVARIQYTSFSNHSTTLKEINVMWTAAYEIAYETDETVQDILSKLGGT